MSRQSMKMENSNRSPVAPFSQLYRILCIHLVLGVFKPLFHGKFLFLCSLQCELFLTFSGFFHFRDNILSSSSESDELWFLGVEYSLSLTGGTIDDFMKDFLSRIWFTYRKGSFILRLEGFPHDSRFYISRHGSLPSLKFNK